MFGGQRAASAMVRVCRAMPLLPELVPMKGGFDYRHGAPAEAFASFIPAQAELGLPASFRPVPGRSTSTPLDWECTDY